MRKRALAFIIFLALLASFLFIAFNTDHQEAISVKQFSRLESKEKEIDLKIIGDISEISKNSFTIVDLEFPEDEIMYSLQSDIPMKDFATGDTVFVSGNYNVENLELEALDIKKISRDNALRHLRMLKPSLDVKILKYKQNVGDICEEIDFEIKLKNTGQETITYEDLYDENYGYSIVYILNETEYPYFFMDNFESIKPGEEKTITLKVEDAIKKQMVKDENSIQFAWAQKSLYSEEFLPLNLSEEVKIYLKDTNCE
jgi:hypothetical protein